LEAGHDAFQEHRLGCWEDARLSSTIQLSTYVLQFKDRETGEFIELNNILGNDFLDLFQEYLDDRSSEAHDDEERQQLLRCDQYERADDRTIAGIFESGEYGFAADLYNVVNQATAYHREPSDAELLPFYFLVSVPDNEQRAVLVLQRFRQYGVRSAMWSDLVDYMQSYRQDFVISLEPLVPAGVVEQIQESEDIKSVRFIKFSLPSDIADELDPEHQLEEEDGVLELTVKANRGSHLPAITKVTDWLRGGRELGEVIQLQGVEYDQVKVQVDIAGKTRTVDISDFGRIRGQIDVTGQVDVDASGHPTYDSIDEAARDILEDMQQQLGM
jgi:hypothetical protein